MSEADKLEPGVGAQRTDEPESWGDAARELYALSEHRARTDWEAHGNPLAIWELILRRGEAARLASEDKWTRVGHREPLPDWVSDYLEGVAWRLDHYWPDCA